jgi:hypothetical protein
MSTRTVSDSVRDSARNPSREFETLSRTCTEPCACEAFSRNRYERCARTRKWSDRENIAHITHRSANRLKSQAKVREGFEKYPSPIAHIPHSGAGASL